MMNVLCDVGDIVVVDTILYEYLSKPQKNKIPKTKKIFIR